MQLAWQMRVHFPAHSLLHKSSGMAAAVLGLVLGLGHKRGEIHGAALRWRPLVHFDTFLPPSCKLHIAKGVFDVHSRAVIEFVAA